MGVISMHWPKKQKSAILVAVPVARASSLGVAQPLIGIKEHEYRWPNSGRISLFWFLVLTSKFNLSCLSPTPLLAHNRLISLDLARLTQLIADATVKATIPIKECDIVTVVFFY